MQFLFIIQGCKTTQCPCRYRTTWPLPPPPQQPPPLLTRPCRPISGHPVSRFIPPLQQPQCTPPRSWLTTMATITTTTISNNHNNRRHRTCTIIRRLRIIIPWWPATNCPPSSRCCRSTWACSRIHRICRRSRRLPPRQAAPGSVRRPRTALTVAVRVPRRLSRTNRCARARAFCDNWDESYPHCRTKTPIVCKWFVNTHLIY